VHDEPAKHCEVYILSVDIRVRRLSPLGVGCEPLQYQLS